MQDAKTKLAKKRVSASRRNALRMLGAAGVAAAGATTLGKSATAIAQAPAVRKKVKLTYWNWADNPVHQSISVDSVNMFNKSQSFIEVEVDATMAVMESRKKLVTSFAAGAAPDVAMMVQYWAQDYYDNGILFPVEEYFNKWDAKSDFLPNVIEQVRSKPGQPILYTPQTSIPYFLFYRADWLKEAKLQPPKTYDEFIAAARAVSKPPDRYGLAMRGQTYSAIQVILPIWASAGVKFVDEKGNVDFDSPAAIAVTEKWVGLLTKDNAAQPTAVSDGYREQYALMEKGKCGFWYYGPHAGPALIKALGDNIQAENNPRVGPNHYMLANPEGPLMTTSCKEKDAAWEFIKFIASGDALLLYTAKRSVPPVRKSMFNNPAFADNRFIKMSLAASDTWYMPPYYQKNWANFQDKIPPYWQETLRQKITPRDFHVQGAKFLRGQA
jgi:multiple sugar transport system substrate-binding protein